METPLSQRTSGPPPHQRLPVANSSNLQSQSQCQRLLAAVYLSKLETERFHKREKKPSKFNATVRKHGFIGETSIL